MSLSFTQKEFFPDAVKMSNRFALIGDGCHAEPDGFPEIHSQQKCASGNARRASMRLACNCHLTQWEMPNTQRCEFAEQHQPNFSFSQQIKKEVSLCSYVNKKKKKKKNCAQADLLHNKKCRKHCFVFIFIYFFAARFPRNKKRVLPSLGGLEPPTFRLTAERANRLRHRDRCADQIRAKSAARNICYLRSMK